MFSNIYLILTLVILHAYIAFLVLTADPKSKINRSFFILILAITFWIIANFLADLTHRVWLSLLLAKLTFVATAIIFPSILYFSLVFPREEGKKLLLNNKLISLTTFLIIPAVFSIISLFTNYIVDKVEIMDWGANVMVGQGVGSYIVYFSVYTIYAIWVLVNKGRKMSQQREKDQLKLVFIGTFVTLLLGAFTNLILPVITANSFFSSFGPNFTTIFVFFTAFAILRHRFLDIEVIIKRSVTYAVLATVVASIYAGSVVLFGNILQNIFGESVLWASAITGILITIGFQPLKDWLTEVTDRFLFQKSYNYRQTLQEISRTLNNTIVLDNIVKLLMIAFINTIKVKTARIVIQDRKTNQYIYGKYSDQVGEKFEREKAVTNSPLIDLLKYCSRIITRENLESVFWECASKHKKDKKLSTQEIHDKFQEIKEELKAMGAEVIIPVYHTDNLTGFFVLGEKQAETPLTNSDLELLETIGHQAGTAIENAWLYEETKEKVTELSLLYNVGKDINTSLNTGDFYNQALTIMTSSIMVDRAILGQIKENNEIRIIAVKAEDVVLSDIQDVVKSTDYGIYPFLLNSTQPIILLPKDFSVLALPQEEFGPFKIESEVMFIPLISREKYLGYIAVDNKYSKKPLAALNTNLIMAFAGQLAVALENIALHEEAIKAQEQAARSERLAALGTVTAGFAHEIKNPMVALKTFTDMLPKKFNDEGFRHKYMEIVPREVHRVNNLVEEMLMLSRNKKPLLNPVQMQEVINEVADLLKEDMQKNDVSFKFENKEMPVINGNKDQLKQVFLNLLKNAIEAMPRGGDLAVSTKLLLKKKQLQLQVSDSGVGISEERLLHVFEPFYTTRHEGTGLGLAITEKIISDHNGTITVSSKVNKGTTFTVVLPITV
ncbi:MAG: ATP-binding protein [Candidatus Margulisiibacteriota bacterium]|jgi:signal transduction histidine kinase